MKKSPQQAQLTNVGEKSNSSSSNAAHRYHKCRCYGHEDSLPNYKLLTIPRTNNYYAATGGCPCVPRVAAHPGSWRMKEAQLRSSTYGCGSGCNLAFKSKSGLYRPVEDDVSEVSSASPQKLEDLEALILEEHQQRMRVEEDVEELAAIQQTGTADIYKKDHDEARRRHQLAQVSEAGLQELLREVKDIADRPLNQTNMELLHRILLRQEHLQRQREYYAAQA